MAQTTSGQRRYASAFKIAEPWPIAAPPLTTYKRLLRLGDQKILEGIARAQRDSQVPFLVAWFFTLLSPRGLDIISIILYLLAFYIVAKYTHRALLCPLSKFPGPRLAGITKLYEAYHVLIRNDWLENLESLHEKYGPVVRIGPNELHFIDHQFCLEYHKRPDLLKCDNYYGLLNKLLGGLASPTKHIQRASAVRPIFSGKTLARFTPTLDGHLESLYKRLNDVAGTEDAVNLTHYFWAFTNDVMVSYLVEEDYGFLRIFDLEAVHNKTRAFSAIDLATVLRCMPPIKFIFDTFPILRSYSPLGWLDTLVRNHAKPIVKSWDDEISHEGILIRMFNEIGSEILTIHESSQAIFIGNESLLSNLTFLLHHLMQNPDCIKKVRDELDTLDSGLYGHRIWRDPRVLQLTYLDSIIPPMTSMSFTLRLLEHDPELYPEPNTFDPDRWLGIDEDTKEARSRAVTFGTGTRTCLGQHIAHRVLRKTIACILYNFNVSLWDQKLDMTTGYRYLDTYPKKGHEGYMKVRLSPRFEHKA
ncbi:Cytochrome P450 monooxygenase SAT11 [Colletotrichum fructicola Nara gc5]|uniref:Cytochrome P450 monooxygenase SAT11 n=1 Tax=Colletotrichum fructicola (strain Nara gc5) TaxID=1213859 RepID=A0A7J6J7J9_COLFN|nr:Cytochrome P450 monooxygenase SAT11 [Colletotrichum fructicola Nara gc5]